MNKFFNYFTAAALILVLGVFSSCGSGGDDPADDIDPCKVNADVLVSGTATVKKVTNPDGTIVTSDWTGFTLSFSGTKEGGNYTTNVTSLDDASLANIWAASGSWSFDASDANCKKLTVNGGHQSGARTVTISAITTQGLNLSFNVPAADTQRTMGIPGDWFFEFDF